MNDLIEKAKKIQCVICDVDGVLTDGLLYYDTFGHEQKTFNVQDGMGLKMLLSAGIEVAVITTSTNEIIDHRMKQLTIKHYYKGQVEKETAYKNLKQRLNLTDDAFAYVGDDLPDLPIIRQVGFGVAVANAVPQVKSAAVFHTVKSGGQGAVREVCDFILTSQDAFEKGLNGYLAG